MKVKLLPFILLHFALLTGLYSQTYSVNDSLALLNIDASCDVSGMLNWNIESDPGNWDGVSWNIATPKNVTGLVFPHGSLAGAIDVSPLNDLSLLSLGINQINSIHLSSLQGFAYLDCSYNELTEIDVSENFVFLLDCTGNKLSSLKLSSDLEELYCADNQLTEIDLSGLLNLKAFYCDSNQLTYLDLSANINLQALLCSNNQLTLLDLSAQTQLIRLECNYNTLSSINVSLSATLNEFKCYHNKLPFSLLAQGLQAPYFDYAPQDTLFEPLILSDDTTIDYSQEALIEGTATEFIFYKDAEETETNSTGLFTITGPGVYHCEMTNALFPGLTLTTAPVTIVPLGVEEESLKEIEIYPNPVNDILHIHLTQPEDISQISIYSTDGKELLYFENVTSPVEIDMENFSSGIYILKVITAGSGFQEQIIKR